MKRIGRRPVLLFGGLVAACGGAVAAPGQPDASVPAPPEPPPAPDARPPFFEPQGFDAAPSPPPGACVDREPGARLTALAGLGHDRPYAARVYSYTTKAQADALRAGAPLLSKSTSDSGHRGYLFDVLEARARLGDQVATMLAGETFALGRFGWPFLVGARMSPERYGDEIIQIDLAPEAWLAVIRTSDASLISFVDAAGRAVPPADVAASPARVGAFYFVNETSAVRDTFGLRCRGTLTPGLVYRELYLGSPTMIREYSLGTQAILDRLGAEVADLRALARGLDCGGASIGPSCGGALQRWTTVGPSRHDQLVASTAFASAFGWNGLYPSDLTRLADGLDALRFAPRPYVGRP